MLFANLEEIDHIEHAETGKTPRKIRRQNTFTEDEIDERLQALQEAVVLPDDVWTCLLWTLCPEAMEEPPLPKTPTKSLPGTAERIAVMAARAMAGESLHHPDDATWEDKDADRIAVAGCRLRNGVTSRTQQPLVVQRHDGLHELPNGVKEGFILPSERTVVVGRLEPTPPRKKKKKQEKPSGPQQMLLPFAEAA